MIQYPNRIDDHHTVVKLRELIDHSNALKGTVDGQTTTIAAHTADLASLPRLTLTEVQLAINSSLVAAGITPKTISEGIAIPLEHVGLRTEAPLLGPDDADFIFYCSDYAHFAIWDGEEWRIDDPGGYFVEATVDLGIGWQICDGTTTDYLAMDLTVLPFTTPDDRGTGRQRYLRR